MKEKDIKTIGEPDFSAIKKGDDSTYELDLAELFKVLWAHKIKIILVSILTAALMFGYAFYMVTPTYESTAKLYMVSTSNDSLVDLTDLSVGSSLTKDYEELIMSYPVLDEVSEKLGMNMNYKQLKGMINLVNPDGTRVLRITATTSNPQLSMDIANTVAEVTVAYLPDTMSTNPPNIAQRARISETPVGPNYKKYICLGFLLGFILMCIYYLISAMLDDTIKDAEGMEKNFGFLPLASIPKVPMSKALAKSGNLEYGKLKLDIHNLPYAAEEAMNRLRINVKFCGENTRKILVASTLPAEGKSSVSFHLWRLLAEAGFKTVLVDVDLRNSEFKQRLDLENEDLYGIGHYLSGQAELRNCLYSTSVENGDMILCTENISNPSSLFEDPKFEELLNILAEDYRYVIIDSPPIRNVSDGLLVASVSDGALLVTRAGLAHKNHIRQVIDQIERTGCSVLGTVMNFVEAKSGKYGKYGKGYGNDYGYGKSGK